MKMKDIKKGIDERRELMNNQIKKLNGRLNEIKDQLSESKAPRELKKHLGKTIKDIKYNDGFDVQELTIFFTDGTKLEVSAYSPYEDSNEVDMDWEL